MNGFLQRIESQVQKRGLLSSGSKVLVAVSGGVDSMVLLHALKILSSKYKWKIVVAHFNHKLRGRASDADEKLVRNAAKKLKLPLIAESADVKAFARDSRISIEMAARKFRHEFFARTAKAQKIKTIALAHHADDQVELFFLRLLRGTGSEGLSGMKWRSPSPANKMVSLVRPLLDCSKSELLEFARENKIQFRDDATNFSSDFMRNRIRNELLPLLRKNYQPAINKSVLRLMEIIQAESEFVGDSSKSFDGEFNSMPVAIQRRILQARLVESEIVPDFDLIESLRQTPNQSVSVGGNVSVARDALGKIQLRREREFKSQFVTSELAIDLGRAGEAAFEGMKLIWKTVGSRGRSPHRNQNEFFDADKIGGKIILRHWRAGDRFQPIGMKSPKKLQDLFVNAKIPQQKRHNLVLAVAESGEVFWVEGLRISENFKLTPETKRRLVWRWKNQG